jgi:hypothetical protein
VAASAWVARSGASERGSGVPVAESADGGGGNSVKREPSAGAEASCACERGRRGPACRGLARRPRERGSARDTELRRPRRGGRAAAAGGQAGATVRVEARHEQYSGGRRG